jgi:membrane protease YdiL (CAAX protease family)
MGVVMMIIFGILGAFGIELDTLFLYLSEWGVNGILTIIMYLFFFLAFLAFSKSQGAGFKDLMKHYDVKAVPAKDVAILIPMAIIFVYTFLLLHTGLIEVFIMWGYPRPMGTIEIPHFGVYILLVFAICVMPAIVEEFIFRGMIQRTLEKWNTGKNGPIFAIVASAVLFSLFHMSPAQTLSQFFMGLLWAWVYHRTKNLSYPIILHFLNNFWVLTYSYVIQLVQGVPEVTEPVPFFTLETILLMVGFAVVGSTIIVFMVRGLKKADTKPTEGQAEAALAQPTAPSYGGSMFDQYRGGNLDSPYTSPPQYPRYEYHGPPFGVGQEDNPYGQYQQPQNERGNDWGGGLIPPLHQPHLPQYPPPPPQPYGMPYQPYPPIYMPPQPTPQQLEKRFKIEFWITAACALLLWIILGFGGTIL